jgi:hypothetical protein
VTFEAASAAGPATRVPARRRLVQAGLLLVLLSATVLQRFGVNAGALSTSAALIAIYVFLALAGLAGALAISSTRVMLCAACLCVALSSLMLNEAGASLPSLILVVAMYLPFVFVLEPGSVADDDAGWVLARFVDIATICAVFGVVQFLVQPVLHADWLFDFTPYIPEPLRAAGTFNTTISLGSFNKSNGFFFREPSGFSYLMALGLAIEWTTRKRSWRLLGLGLALLLTYSGTGILALLLATMHPLGLKTVVRLVVLALLGAAVFWLLGDALNLSLTLDRVGEFNSEHSSAYMRYIAPMRLLSETFDSAWWTPLVGHGPGMIFRTAREYEFHDPTWAKLLFEYGALGFVLFVALFATMLRRPNIPVQVRAALFWGWLILGGHLLSPEHNFLSLALIGLAAPGAAPRVKRPSRSDDVTFAPALAT